MWCYNGGIPFGGMSIISLILLGLVIWCVLGLISKNNAKNSASYFHDQQNNNQRNSAIALLDERLVRGEITQEEYRSIKNEIQK